MANKNPMGAIGLMLGMVMMGGMMPSGRRDYPEHFDRTDPLTEEEKADHHGLKKWNINGATVYAATKKAAEKKAKNKVDGK